MVRFFKFPGSQKYPHKIKEESYTIELVQFPFCKNKLEIIIYRI